MHTNATFFEIVCALNYCSADQVHPPIFATATVKCILPKKVFGNFLGMIEAVCLACTVVCVAHYMHPGATQVESPRRTSSFLNAIEALSAIEKGFYYAAPVSCIIEQHGSERPGSDAAKNSFLWQNKNI